jgi:hypothetical protein
MYTNAVYIGKVCTARTGLAARDGMFIWDRDHGLGRVLDLCFLAPGLLLLLCGLIAFL